MSGKAELVDGMVNEVRGLTKRQAGEIFDTLFKCIADELRNGERVQIPKFGSFAIADRPARRGRNPATGASMEIPASRNVRFKPGKDLKETVRA